MIEDTSVLKNLNRQSKANKQQTNSEKRRQKIEREIQKKYRPYSIMNIDLDQEYKSIDPSLVDQISSFYSTAKAFKIKYLSEQEQIEQELERELTPEDLLYLPLKDSKLDFVNLKVKEFFQQEEESQNPINYFYQGLPSEEDASVIANLRMIMRSQRANTSDIAKYVRIIPFVLQLIKSPFYRVELDKQFTEWRKMRIEIIKTKLNVSNDPRDDLYTIPEETEQTQESASDEDTLKKALDDLQTTKESIQQIKFGGILKMMLDLWTVEDIYQAFIICTYWMCGKLNIESVNDDEDFEITIEAADYIPIDCAGSEQDSKDQSEAEYIENMLGSFESKKNAENFPNKKFSNNEIKTVVKMTFNWIYQIQQSKNQYERFKESNESYGAPMLKADNIYRNLDQKLVTKLALQSFIEEIDSVETLCSNLLEFNPIFEDIEFNIGEQTTITLNKVKIEQIINAENNTYELLEDIDKYHNNMRTIEEVKQEHVIIWVITNLLLQDNRHYESREEFRKSDEMKKNLNTKMQNSTLSTEPDLMMLITENTGLQNAQEINREKNPEDDFPPQPGLLETYSNLHKISNYIPLTKIMNHFYCSFTDNLWLDQQLGNASEHDQLLTEYCLESQVIEITYELLKILSIMKKEETTTKIFTSKKKPKIGKEQLWNFILTSIDAYLNLVDINEDKPNK